MNGSSPVISSINALLSNRGPVKLARSGIQSITIDFAQAVNSATQSNSAEAGPNEPTSSPTPRANFDPDKGQLFDAFA